MKRLNIAAATLACAVALSSCGADPSANDQVPGLGNTLAKVQRSLADGETDRAQAQLRALIAQTTTARDAGDLSDAQARSVLGAAATLLAALPEPAPPPAPVSTPPPADAGDGDRDDDSDEKDDKKDRERPDKDKDDDEDD